MVHPLSLLPGVPKKLSNKNTLAKECLSLANGSRGALDIRPRILGYPK